MQRSHCFLHSLKLLQMTNDDVSIPFKPFEINVDCYLQIIVVWSDIFD